MSRIHRIQPIVRPNRAPAFIRSMVPAIIHNQFVTNDAIQASAPAAAVASATANIQTMREFAGTGAGRSVIQRLIANNMDIRALRTNDLLRKEEWVQLDTAMIQIATVRLRPLEILRQRGLTKALDGLGVLISQYERLSDMTEAEVSMSGIARTQEDSSNFDLISVPVPVISKDFRINIRRLMASRRNGEGVDVTQIQTATRKVSEMVVQLIFYGYPGKLDGQVMEGLLTATNRNLVSGSGSWGAQGNAYNDIVTTITALQGDHFFGPYGLFVNNTSYLQLLTYVSNVNQTFLQRIQSIPNLAFVEPADQLAAGRAVLFQLTPDVFDIGIAQDITNVEWDEKGGLEADYKVMTALTMRPKNDQSGQSGIADISGIQ